MKKLLWLFLLSGAAATAQKNLTIQQATYGQYQDFAVKSLAVPHWRPDTHTVTYLDETYQNLMARSEDGQWAEKILLTKADVVTAFQKVSDDKASLQTFPTDYTWKDKSTLKFEIQAFKSSYIVLYNIEKKEITSVLPFTSGGQNFISPKGTEIAYTNENNIIIERVQTGFANTFKVTEDTDKAIVNGSDYVHRQEFGIDRGMWWSPNSDKLLYYHKDETMVADYPLVQWSERIAEDKEIKYPMAGMKSEEVTLVIYDITGKTKTTLKTEGDKEQFLTSVTWSPDGKFIFVGVLNRGQNHLKLNKYDAVTGNLVKTLFEEQATTYVEPLHGLIFVPGKNDQFLYRTEKEGYEQLYLYNTDGRLIKKLGFKDVVVTELLNFDTDAKNVFYIGTANNGLDRQLYKAELKSGKTVQVTQGLGTHS
ncbi:MAG: DPP IV N-terminal domain-containing protein, partial [Bacteroidota bacterium]